MTVRPRLLIDLSAAFNQGAGIGRYARNLVGAAAPELSREFELAGWYAPDPATEHRFRDLASRSLGELAGAAHRSPLSRRRIDQLWFRMPLGITARLLVPRAAVVYSPDFTAPPILDAETIVTVHDLAFLKTPEHCPEPLRRYLTMVVPTQLERARRVAVVSEATRHDVIETYRIDERLVTVIPNAADDRFFDAAALSEDARTAHGVPERYLLTVGTLEPRKNYPTIFAAMERIYAETRIPLVVVGRDGWANAEIRRTMTGLVARGMVIDVTNANDDLLPGLYGGAAAVIQLSWYEGFGIPVIEALAAGAPVVASDIPAHREVAGGAATLVPPGDLDAVVAATLETLTGHAMHDPGLARRAARRFSWDRSGTMLAELLREVKDDREPGRRVPANPV